MATDEQYIEMYNKLGSSYFCKGSDEKLKEWGNSDEEIRKIKIDSVKFHLDWYKNGIEVYKMMNVICGGINEL